MNTQTKTFFSGIYFDDGGSGELPIVFLHSLAGNTKQWTAQLQHFRKNRRAIAIDLPGHGRSTANGNFAIKSMAQNIHTVVQELDIERLILVGHSMGGSVAVAYASAYSNQVAGLLLVDPSGDSTQMPAEEVQGYLGALQSEAYEQMIGDYWQQILAGSTPETEEIVMSDLRHTSKNTVVGVSEELFNYNPLPALLSYEGPIFSLITRLNEFPNSLHNLVPTIPHKMVTGTGHWLHMDKPGQFNDFLDNWMAEVDWESELISPTIC